MVSAEKGLPDGFDPLTGRNVKWTVPIGTHCYSTPVVSGGRVFIGTNNAQPRDPRHDGDRGVMMCFDESDGRLVWQLVVPKLEADVYHDWPQAGICSPATVDGDYVYTVTNRDEVVCLDIHGMANGNDGPYQDEGRHMAPRDQKAMTPGPLDADIVWLLDLRTAAGVRPHDSAHASILIDGPYLYLNTSNGLNSQHSAIEKPDAPALVVVDKATGRLLAQEREGISSRIFHCAWSSPALGEVNGRRTLFFAGDGHCYGFEALPLPQPVAPVSASESPTAKVEALKCLWQFDCDPTAPKENLHSYIRNRSEGPSFTSAMPVYDDGRVYLTVGGDIWWGKRQAWLQCIDATGAADTTASALKWSYPVERHCCTTPSVHEGLVYVADCGGKVHCVDAATGKAHWVHEAGGEMWASTLVADGKVYIGTRRGDFWVLAAGKQLNVLSHVRLDDPIISTATAANGLLYVCTMQRLYALQAGAASIPPSP
jgi:outer membrane protein assembly factor BamB